MALNSQGCLAMSVDLLCCHTWGDVTGIFWTEARGAIKPPTMQRVALQKKTSDTKCQYWGG